MIAPLAFPLALRVSNFCVADACWLTELLYSSNPMMLPAVAKTVGSCGETNELRQVYSTPSTWSDVSDVNVF